MVFKVYVLIGDNKVVDFVVDVVKVIVKDGMMILFYYYFCNGDFVFN